MDVVTMSDLRDLVSSEEGRCVSMYMPTYPAGSEGQQDELRLRNLVARAEQVLIDRGMREVEAHELLLPLIKVTQSVGWRQRKQSLVIFQSLQKLSIYWLDTPIQETLVVGRRFYVKPLLPACSFHPNFFVLAISRNQVRLLKATSKTCERVDLPSLPTRMEIALNLQGADRGEQVHSGMRGDMGKEAAVFHGQGGHRDTMKDELTEYFRLINMSLNPLLQQTKRPLILAGVDYELALFRGVCEYTHISDESLHGNFDYVDDAELCERASQIARRLYGLQRQEALANYQRLRERNRASDDIEEIIPAAHEGKIDSLYIDSDARLYGHYDTNTKSIEVIDGFDPTFDLIELAIEQTVLHRGTVYPVTRDELPAGTPMCAIFRY